MGGHINIVYLESHQDQILHQDHPSVTAISWQIVLIVDPVLYIDYSQYCSGLYISHTVAAYHHAQTPIYSLLMMVAI